MGAGAGEIILILLAAASACFLLYSVVALARICRAMRSAPLLQSIAGETEVDRDAPEVCVVVPAHNEEAVIAGLVESLKAQDHPAMRVVIALDRCSDRTEEVIRDAVGSNAGGPPAPLDKRTAGETPAPLKETGPRFEIVTIDACPDDWAGKTHAVWRAVRESESARDADLLLFTDADTLFHPSCVRAAVAALEAGDLSMLSLLGVLHRRRWFERIVQPMAAFELLRRFPLERVNRDQRCAAFANGQFMLFRRDAYEQIGGHEAVRDALLEDLALARACRRAGLRWRVLFGGRLFSCRMYGDWPAFKRGWSRIFIEASKRKANRLRKGARRMAATNIAGPAVASITIIVGAGAAAGGSTVGWSALLIGAAALLVWATGLAFVLRAQGAPARWIIATPIGAWLVAKLLHRAASDLQRGRAMTWGGREYHAIRENASEPKHASARAEAAP